MSPERYKIEVLTFRSPHLIWIEVSDTSLTRKEFVFEQVGVYGVLPLNKTLDLESMCLRTEKCEEWSPAANVFMKEFLDKNCEVWFSPIHDEKNHLRTIFDESTHKFGDLLIKTEDGKKKKLSKHLVKSGFAYYDVFEFEHKLNNGKLKTKLSPIKTQEVIKELENDYMRTGKPKNIWTMSVEKHTSLFRLAQLCEDILPGTNYEKVNHEELSKTLKNKYQDLELCKDADDEELEEHSETECAKLALNRAIFKSRKIRNPEINMDVAKENKGSIISIKLKQLKVNRNSHSEVDCDSPIEDKFEKNTSVDVAKFIENTKIKDTNVSKTDQENLKIAQENFSKLGQFRKPIAEVQQNKVDVCKNFRGNVKSTKVQNCMITYGPPGLDPKLMTFQEMTVKDNDEGHIPNICLENDKCSNEIEMMQEKSIKECLKNVGHTNGVKEITKSYKSDTDGGENICIGLTYFENDTRDSSDKVTFSLIEHKLKTYQNAVKHTY